MKPAPFSYVRPNTVEECIELLARHADDAKVLAGGQSLVPLMNLRLAMPEVVVDINRIQGLAGIVEEGGQLVIGALTRHRALVESPLVARLCPLLVSAGRLVGYPAIRARGTVGGSLAHAHPTSELPLAALVLGAELDVAGPTGRRTVPAHEFFTGFFTTALEASDVLLAARFPAQDPQTGWSFHEASRKSGDFAQAAVAVTLGLTGGALRDVAIAVAGVADRPQRAAGVEAALTGSSPSGAVFADAAQDVVAALGAEASGPDADYRCHLVGVLTERALVEACERAGGIA